MTKPTSAPSLSINLVKKQGNSTLDAVLHWAITIGRFLVILTQTVALAALLYRFVLDRQVIDLSDNIKQNTAVLNAYAQQETTYRALQDKLSHAKELDKISGAAPTLYSSIVAIGQGNVTFTALSFTEGSIRMEILTGSINSLNTFVNSLRALETLSNVSIDRIENRTSAAVIAVTISAQLTGDLAPEEVPVSAARRR
jgi:Tfp pilus assembly protein PilN